GNIKAEHGVFACEALFLAPRNSFAQFEWRRRRGGGSTEQPVLAGFAGAGSTLQGRNRIIYRSEHRFARSERIHRSGFNEAFKYAFVQKARLDALAEIVQRLELSLAESRFTNGFGGILSDVLDRCQTEANRFTDGSEVEVALIYIGRTNGNTHSSRFIDIFNDFFGVASFRSQQRGHEFHRIMRFQVSRLVCKQRVGAGMRLVELVAGRLLHQVDNDIGVFIRTLTVRRPGLQLVASR